jgi:hypothetical protein
MLWLWSDLEEGKLEGRGARTLRMTVVIQLLAQSQFDISQSQMVKRVCKKKECSGNLILVQMLHRMTRVKATRSVMAA